MGLIVQLVFFYKDGSGINSQKLMLIKVKQRNQTKLYIYIYRERERKRERERFIVRHHGQMSCKKGNIVLITIKID